MHRSTLDVLRCPDCGSMLSLQGEDNMGEVETGTLICAGCTASYPIERGIPRFVPPKNYADNFGVQWNLFKRTQLDSYSGQPISRNRFTSYTGWTEEQLCGRLVLDAGCGSGRFAEVALSLGARVIAIDFSNAVDAARENLGDKGEIDFVQADIDALPFAPGTFDAVYSLGVLPFTPDPGKSFRSLGRITAPNGRLCIDVYPAGWKNIFFAKYWIRPITRRIGADTSLKLVRRLFSPLYRLSRLVSPIPVVGHYLRYLIPVVNYTDVYPLNDAQLREWALLDTYDMWAPAYDKPQTVATVRTWFRDAGFTDVEALHMGFVVGRGVKASP
jgi:SAM-dependent methyltransferase